jgi:exonuclease VII large subunit
MYEIKEQKLDILIDNLKNNMENIITKKTHLYENITSSYILTNPMILIDNKSNKLDILIKSLSLLNPMSILDKGYSIVKHDDKVIKQIKDVKKGDNIDITLAKGIISAKVMEVKNGK